MASTVSNTLHLALDKPFPDGLSAYTFTVDDQVFDIKFSQDSTRGKYWSISGPPWSDGQVIKLSLIKNTKVVPTVEFSPPNPSVDEGETAIMRYTLPNVTAGGLTLQFEITESPPASQYMVQYSGIRDGPGGAWGTFDIYVAQDNIPEREQRLEYRVWFLKGGLVVSEGSGVVTIPANDYLAFDGKHRHDYGGATTSGCSDTNTAITYRCTSAITNNVVTFNGTTYRITELYAMNSDELRITISDNFDINNLANYTLRLPESTGTTDHLHFRDANLTGSTAIWSVNDYHQFILPTVGGGEPGWPVQIVLTSFLNPQGQLAAAASADTEEGRIATSHEQSGTQPDGPPPYFQDAPSEETPEQETTTETPEQETSSSEDTPEQETTTETPEQETSSSEDTPEQETPPTEDAPESIVAQYDTDGSGAIEQDEWSRAIGDYASGKLTNEEIYAISAARA